MNLAPLYLCPCACRTQEDSGGGGCCCSSSEWCDGISSFSCMLLDIWIQIMINTSMDRGEHPLHSEHTFARIIWIFLGVMDIIIIGWCATVSTCSSSLETVWSISFSVFGYSWWWMHEWIEQINSFMLNTRLHQLNDNFGYAAHYYYY